MRQYRIVGIANPEDYANAERLMNGESLNNMGTFRPEPEMLEKIISLPIEGVVIYARDTQYTKEIEFAEKLFMMRKDIAVILACENASRKTYEDAMRVGVTKIIEVSPDTITDEELLTETQEDITDEIERICARTNKAAVKEYDSRVIGFFGTKGGCGKSTIATNTAACLARHSKKVVIIDLDLQFGDVSIILNIDPKETISELAEEKNITPAIVKSYLKKTDDDIYVLCAPLSPELADLVHPEFIRKVITILRVEFDYVILDLSPTLDECILTAFEEAESVYFITNPEITNIKNAKACLPVLESLRLDKKVKVILNKAGASSITASDVEATLGRDVVATIPLNVPDSIQAANRGVPILISAPKSNVSKAINKFVESEFKNGTKGEIKVVPKEKKKGLFG